MNAFAGLILFSILGMEPNAKYTGPIIIPRSEWGARSPKSVETFTPPAEYVIIHHSVKPDVCYTSEECKKAMRSIQDYHMLERHWGDIGYSFVIGGDGLIYTGRGFNVVGAHAINYNARSVGICFMGDWSLTQPPEIMLEAAKNLISFGLTKGYIHPQYKLVGHREVSKTLCPGDSLFNIISKWTHFTPLDEVS